MFGLPFAAVVAPPLRPPPSSETFYIGTYTAPGKSEGIYKATLNVATGAISGPTLAGEAKNPSYVALAPNGKFLYAVDESDKGAVGAFAIDAGGMLQSLGSQPLQGSAPCHLSLDRAGGHLYTASYIGGAVQVLPVHSDGSLGPADGAFLYNGHGPNRDRQEAAHMHWVHVDPTGRFLYACDLGADVVRIEGVTTQRRVLGRTASVPPGAGPRHGVWAHGGRYFYMNNEMGNSVTAFAVDQASGGLTAIQTVSTLPAGAHSVGSAEIAIHPNGRWLYVSNRGHDSIAVFSVGADGELTQIQVAPTGVHIPRGFGIDPTGHWLIAAGQESNNLTSLSIDSATGLLGSPGSPVALWAPVCIVFRR